MARAQNGPPPQKWPGSIDGLRRIVAESGYRGEWRGPEESRFQFRAEGGAILNWWATTKTLYFQGPQDEEARLRAAFISTATRLAASYVERLSPVAGSDDALSGQPSS